MTLVKNVTREKFPRQGAGLNRITDVHVDGNAPLKGKVIRNDIEEPFLTVFLLEDGRCVLDSECVYEADW